MAVDIGPKIGIDGEAEFRKEINNLTQQIKTLGSEMKVVSSEFSGNEDSVESLTAKNDVLSRTIDVQTQKLEALQRGLKASSEKYGEADNNTLKWQQAVNQATADLNRLQSELTSNQGKIENFGRDAGEAADALDDASDSASNFGDVLAGSLGAEAISGAISAITDKIVDLGKELANFSLESENAAVKATSYFGETGEAAEKTQKVIRDVYRGGVGESMDQVSEAVIAVKKNLDDLSETELTDLTNQAITLDSLWGIDMDETLRGTNALMEQFGLSAGEAMDYIVTGTQNGLDKTNELGDNLSEYAGKFSQAGYSAQEYFQLLQNGLDGGAYNLDKVNDAINEVTTRLADGTLEESIGSYSEQTQDFFKAWQNGEATQKEVIDSVVSDIQNAASQQEALTMAATAFGTMAEDGNLKFIESLTTVGDTFTDVEGKAKQMFESTTTSQQTFDAAIRQAQEKLAPIGDKLVEIGTEIIPEAADAFVNMADFFSEHGTTIMSIASGIGAALITWNIGSIIGTLTGAMTKMRTAVLAVNTAVAANPLGALATVIALVVTAVITFIATNEDARKKVLEVWEAIKTKVQEGIETVQKFLERIIEFVKNNWQTLIELLVNPFGAAFKLLYDHCEGFRNIVDNLVSNIKNAFENMKTEISSKVSNISDTLQNGLSSAVDYITELPSRFLGWGSDMIDNLVQGIRNGISKVKNAISDIADTIRSYIHFSEPDVGPLSDFNTYMPDMTDSIVSGIYAGIPKVAAAMQSLTESMVPENTNGAAIAYEHMAAQLTNLQVVLEDGTLVGKLSPKINAILGGYKKNEGRFGL